MPPEATQTEQEHHDAELAAGFAAATKARETTQHDTDPDPEITTGGTAPVAAMTDPWEQRYKALEGKYRAEVPRLAEEVKAMKAKLEEAQLAKPAHAETGTPSSPPPAEVVAFGEEFPTHAQVMDYKANEAARAAIAAETARFEAELAQERAAREQLARDAHFMAISAAHRDWQDLLPDINAWAANLGDPDEQAKASAVLDGGNAIAVVDLYSRFKRETGRASAHLAEPPVTGMRPSGGPVLPGMPGDDKNDLSAGFQLSKQLRAQR